MFEKIGGITMFFDSSHDSRKSMIVGQNALCVMAEIGQWYVNNVHDLNKHEEKGLNTLAKEYAPKTQ